MRIKLSVITVNLNNAEGLRKTIVSVAEQTFTDFEFIIIDGASTDGSVEIIEQYNDKINYWTSETDNGVYSAMNKGILQAKGDYCLFLNSGDFLNNSNILACIFNQNITEDIISGAVQTYSLTEVEKSKVFNRFEGQELTFSDLYFSPLNHQATFIRRELFQKYGMYDEKYKVISDWIFLVKTLVFENVSYRYLQNIISNIDVNGLSSDPSNYIFERKAAIKELLPSRLFSENELDYIYMVTIVKKIKILWIGVKWLYLIASFVLRRFINKVK